MTLTMQDSITPANLTAGADAYLAYVDGHWATLPAVQSRFPRAHLLTMAVFPSDNAMGCDREPGDLAVTDVAGWVKRQLARGVWRPVVYASASNMGACLSALEHASIGRGEVRLLSAHYGAKEHICGPATCAEPGCPACDGTQWTDSAPGANGSLIDQSVLLPDFFGDTSMPLTPADIAAVARATAHLVWTVDGIVPGPDGNKANPFWEPQRSLADLGVQVRAIESSVAAVAAKAGVNPAAIISGVLAGLSPATLAEAIATYLGPAEAQDVLAALAAKLSTPAT
jgi:hypothetical protein